MAAHVLAASTRLPDRNALQIIGPSGAERWSYSRLEAAVRGCGTRLLQAGLEPGDRVLLRLGNSVMVPVAFLGAIAAGLVPVITPPALAMDQITAMAAAVSPGLVLADSGIALPDLPGVPVMDAALLRGVEALAPCDWNMGADGRGDPDRMAWLAFATDAGGQPLPVAHAHRAVWVRGLMRGGWQATDDGDRLLLAGASDSGIGPGIGLLDVWLAGATALVPAPAVTAPQLPLLIKRFDATILAAPPGMLDRMLAAPLPPLPRLRRTIATDGGVTEAIRTAWQTATGTAILETFGTAECPLLLLRGRSARMVPGPRIAVLGPDDTPVPRGTAGKLAIDRHDPGLMPGYPDRPQAMAARLAGDWFLTGHAAVMADDGAVTLLPADGNTPNPRALRAFAPKEGA